MTAIEELPLMKPRNPLPDTLGRVTRHLGPDDLSLPQHPDQNIQELNYAQP